MRADSLALSPQRFLVVALGMLGIAAAVLARSFFLQVMEGDRFAAVSADNAIQDRVLRPPRGVLVDHRGRVLATNRPSFDLTFLPKGVLPDEYPHVASVVASLTDQDSAALLELMRDARKRPFTSVLLAQDVSRRTVAMVAERRSTLPGVLIENRAVRYYPLGPATAHLLGYIGEISQEEIESGGTYIRGDWVGRGGVELALEDALQGVRGRESVEVDALGQSIRQLSVTPPEPGARVVLTADADIQQWAHEAFSGKQGALVAIDPSTGRILGIYSAPTYDPNVFVDRKRSAERAAVFADTSLPLFNRALMSTYSPGSTFKTITMIAGLITGRLTPTTTMSCGGMHAGMKCWKDGGHGSLDLIHAYQNSCNVYFYKAGERVWIEPIHRAARALGLDEFPGFGVGPEVHGVVPTPQWERANVRGPDGEHWGTGDVRNTAIGQGYVAVSPAQMALVAGSAPRGGIRMRPSILERMEGPNGEVLATFDTKVADNLHLSAENVATVREAMKLVVEAGTGRRARIPGLSIGGKTGTAQNPHGQDHAWFICAAPLESPRLAMCVLVEHAGTGGGAIAAPIARYVMERYAVREGWLPDTTALGPVPLMPRPGTH